MVKRSAPVHLGQGASAARATKKVRGDKASPSNAVAVAGEGSLSASGGRGALRARFSSDSKGKGRQLPVQETRSAVAATASTTNGSSSVKASDRADEPTPAFEVIAGSYERLLYGLHCTLDVDGTSAGGDAGALQASMEPIFQFPAHLSSVKTAAASPNGRYLVTGAADDVIKLWDLRRRKEIGGLLAHESDITSLTFPSDQYLVSSSADGTIALFRTKDWSLLRKFKGHKGKVNYVAVHPGGRVALTVGKDRCLRMWDLLGRSTGKSSTSTKLGLEGEVVRWNEDGSKMAIVLDREVRIYSIEMELLHTLASTSRFHDAHFYRDKTGREFVLVACDDSKVRIYAVSRDHPADDDLVCVAELTSHTNRVKGLGLVDVRGHKLAVSISSDGRIRVYSLAALDTPSAEQKVMALDPIAAYDTRGSRLTCLTVVSVQRRKGGATQGREDEEEQDGSSSNDEEESEPESDADGTTSLLQRPAPTTFVRVGQNGGNGEAGQSGQSDDEDEEWTGFS